MRSFRSAFLALVLCAFACSSKKDSKPTDTTTIQNVVRFTINGTNDYTITVEGPTMYETKHLVLPNNSHVTVSVVERDADGKPTRWSVHY